MSITVNALNPGTITVTVQPAPPRSSKHKAARRYTVTDSPYYGFGGTPQEALRDMSDNSGGGGGGIGYSSGGPPA